MNRVLRTISNIKKICHKYQQFLKRLFIILCCYGVVYYAVDVTYSETRIISDTETEWTGTKEGRGVTRHIQKLFQGYLNQTKDLRPYNESEFNRSLSEEELSETDNVPQVDLGAIKVENKKEEKLTLIDIEDFQIKINPNICDVEKIGLVILVHSAISNVEARNIIRETWGKPNITGVNTRLVFVLGLPEDSTKQPIIDLEAHKFNDLIQGEFLDTYRNLSYKNVFVNLWASQFCKQAEFLVKTDDDMFIDLYAVYHITRPYLTTNEYKWNKVLMCPVFAGGKPERDTRSKWYLSETEWKDSVFPNYCTGWLYISTPRTANRLVKMAPTEDFLWIDDVWVTGYLAAAANIKHINLREYFTMMWEKAVMLKSAQNDEIYHNDIIASPTGRQREIAEVLTKNAERCFKAKCYNNIYKTKPADKESMAAQELLNRVLPTYLPL